MILNIMPEINMTIKDKLMIIIYMIIFIAVILTLIFKKLVFILIALSLIIIIFFVYIYDEKVKIDTNETLSNRNLTIIDNKICVKPSIDNPFMNPSIIDYYNNNNNIKACDYNNKIIEDNVNNYFKTYVYKDVNDIYDREFSERQFYTVPASTIPNDRKSYEQWLYYRDKTCKENNGIQCYNNII